MNTALHDTAEAPRPISFASGSVRLAGLEYGSSVAPSVVMVHGMRDHAGSFDPIARALAAHHHVVVPDLRGHGDSDKPGSYTMAELIADLQAAIRHFDLERPVLIGHSLGGQVVTQHAALFPDVVRAVVSLEGLGPPRPSVGDEAEQRLARLRFHMQSLERGYPEPAALPDLDAALARFAVRNPKLDPARARALVERGTEPLPGGDVRWKWTPEVNKVWLSVSSHEMEDTWGLVRCPVLVVTAADAASYWTGRGLGNPMPRSAFQAELVRKIACFPNARHREIEDAGHMLHYDQPKAVLEAIEEFLD